MPNFNEIRPSIMEIMRLFDLSEWPSLPPLIFEFVKFYWLTGSRES